VLVACLLVLVGAIALLRFLFAVIYATGNTNDTLLLELMNQAGISNWQALQVKSGVSSTAIWSLRDGNINALKLSELRDIANALSISVENLLQKLGVILG
jgi:DNA-binding Xre family transcriptional regulator